MRTYYSTEYSNTIGTVLYARILLSIRTPFYQRRLQYQVLPMDFVSFPIQPSPCPQELDTGTNHGQSVKVILPLTCQICKVMCLHHASTISLIEVIKTDEVLTF